MEILEYARRNAIHIDDFIALSISAHKSPRDQRIDDLLAQLHDEDTLVVTELSRLGRSTGQVINLIDHLLETRIRVIVIKQNLTLDKTLNDIQSLTMITMLSLFAQLEHIMISQRTKEALAAKKAQGVALGKPKGTQQESVYDKDRKRIVELLSLGVPARRISRDHLGYGYPSSLNYYIFTRNLRDEAKKLRDV